MTFSWTGRRLLISAVLIVAGLVLLGALMHLMGLRVAVDYAPSLVRSMGGVVSQSQMQNIEDQHNIQLRALQERLSAMQSQLQTLQTTKNQWLKELGWKSAMPLTGEKQPSWMSHPGQGGPLRLLTWPTWARATDAMTTTEETLALTEKTLEYLIQSWQTEQEKMALLPVSGPLMGDFALTSRFGSRADPLTHDRALHEGLDLIASWHTPVVATAPGRVIRSESAGAYGQLVEIEHSHNYITRYAHLDRRQVQVGETVKRGQTLGVLGNSGRSTGPHLHYEILYKNRPVNPEAPLQALWADSK